MNDTERRILKFAGLMNYVLRSDLDEELHETLENMVETGLLVPSKSITEGYLVGPKAPKMYKKLRG